MTSVRSRRPITIDEIDANRQAARIGYVLRRYGGLDVYVPRVPCNDLTGCLHRPSSVLRNGSIRPPSHPATSQSLDAYGVVRRILSDSSEFELPTRDLQDACFSQRNPFGKFCPLFGGRIVLGPGKGIFIICLLFFITLLVQIVLEKELIEEYCGGLPTYIIGCILAGSILISFITLGTTDPGVVPKNYSLQELLIETEEYRARHPNERYFRYCHKCRTCRPPRTFHCSRCDICIRQQENHVWAAGTCVGERSRKSYFFFLLFQTLLGTYLLATNLTIAPHIEKGTDSFTKDLVQVVTCSVAGMILMFFPQGGLFMLLYRMYLIGVGRTVREEYRKYRCYNTEDCFVDEFPFCVNVRNFFCRSITPSVFRRQLNRVDPEILPLEDMPSPWLLEQTLGRSPHFRDSHDLIIQEYVEQEEDDADVLNANRVINMNENVEALRLREVANYARGKTTPSVPLFEHGLSPPMSRIRMPRKSKPSSILQQQISAFQKASKLPKATVSNHKRQKLPVSLSDGCIPRTKDGLQEMIQLSRATQLRRIIQMILLRDREGLVEMSGRVNIAALVGMNRFDPDNLQLLELNNGLPMIAPRRRDPEAAGGHRLGAGVLGIPQMVAAGLLPTARDLASSVETMVGAGRIRRMPPVGRQRYTAITVVSPPEPGPRRVLNMDDDIQINNRTAQQAMSATIQGQANPNSTYMYIPPQMPSSPHQRSTIPFPVTIPRQRQEVSPPPPPPPSTVTTPPINPLINGISDEDEHEQALVENRLNDIII